MTTPRVVCIGIATLDAITLVDRIPGPAERVEALDGRLAGGGVAATAAVALARLGHRVAFIGRVGDDEVGRTIRDGLRDQGVDVDGLALVPDRRSPLTTVLVERATGERALAPYPGDLPPHGLDERARDRCAAADWIHLDQYGAALLPALRAMPRAGRISVDSGVPVDGMAWDGIDLDSPTEVAIRARHPAAATLDDAAARALAAGPRTVVVTRGADGSAGFDLAPDGAVRRWDVPAATVPGPMVSTLGAGDVFHGALLAGLLEDRPLPEAMHRANAAAALACRALDGRTAIPTRAELDAALAGLPTSPPDPATGRTRAHAID
jgi:sulfofructose kinase